MQLTTRLFTLLAIVGLSLGCGSDSRDDWDEDDGDGGTDTGSEYDGPVGSLGGTVLGPNGMTPIAGALVYLSLSPPPEIPDSIYCYECEDMTGRFWTLSNPDGTWELPEAPTGDWYVVVRKGFFQRARQVTITADSHLDVPVEQTSLPMDNGNDGLDQIPNYAVLLANPDQIFNLLGKFGMGQMGAGGLNFGTETFDPFSDDIIQSGYPSSSALFTDQATLDHYHMIFLPCSASALGTSVAASKHEMIRSYVSGGGKVYNSCCVAYWTEPVFPEYIDFYGDDAYGSWDIGRLSGSALATTGVVNDQGLRDWLAVVTPNSSADAFPFQNGYTKVEALVDTNDGHGPDEDDGWVIPYSWVDGSAADDYQGSPLMTTYTYDCGKVFYSVYETSPDSGTTTTPQEFVLLYIILEVGVCEGEYAPE